MHFRFMTDFTRDFSESYIASGGPLALLVFGVFVMADYDCNRDAAEISSPCSSQEHYSVATNDRSCPPSQEDDLSSSGQPRLHHVLLVLLQRILSRIARVNSFALAFHDGVCKKGACICLPLISDLIWSLR